MRKIIPVLIMIALPALAGLDLLTGPGIQRSGTITNGNYILYENGYAKDSGLNQSSMTNAVAIANLVQTNTINNIIFDSDKDQPNGVAGLDSNGKIRTEQITDISYATIIIDWAGTPAVPAE